VPSSLTEYAPLALIAVLVVFSVLRAVLPRRVRVLRDPQGVFEIQRPPGRRLLDIGRLGFWTVLMVLLFVASWWAEFILGALVSGVAIAVLLWRALFRLGRSSIVINRLADEVLDGERRIGRASNVRAVIFRAGRREPLSLIFRDGVEPDRRWAIPYADQSTAESIGLDLAEYLQVPLERAGVS